MVMEEESEEVDPCRALLRLHNETGGRELDVMEYLAKCSGPSRVNSCKHDFFRLSRINNFRTFFYKHSVQENMP